MLEIPLGVAREEALVFMEVENRFEAANDVNLIQ
jgi:hypothetical protein